MCFGRKNRIIKGLSEALEREKKARKEAERLRDGFRAGQLRVVEERNKIVDDCNDLLRKLYNDCSVRVGSVYVRYKDATKDPVTGKYVRKSSVEA